ncbi:TonB family protein [Phenylobacterium sp.]|uniref:TonB family protein n=1 Tax=Phenylobacterium sp. TaxID=1871053 RepID=UPI00286EA372|nr:TonB family protein [Phenylobacterium sp.]
MIRMMAAALAGLLMLAASAGGAVAQTNPDWLEKPDGAALGAVYPKFAQLIGVEGRALISCKVARTGRLDNCGVLSETPEGLGFGKAALSLVPYFRVAPATADGSAREGMVRIPIRFALPPGDPRGGRVLVGSGVLLAVALGLALNDLLRGPPRLPVGAATGYALRTVATAWRCAPGAVILYLGLVLMGFWTVQPGPAGSAPQVLVGLASVLAGLMVQGAVLRMGFAEMRSNHPEDRLALWGLKPGLVELRLLAASLVQGLLVAGLVIALGAVAVAVNLTGERVPMIAAMQPMLNAAMAGVGVLVVIYVAIRLWTLPAATAFHRRVALAETWRATRSALFSPLAASVLIVLVGFLLGAIPVAAAAALKEATQIDLMRPSMMAYGLIVYGLFTPATAGLQVFAFKTLHRPEAN